MPWPAGRTAAFVTGAALLALSAAPPLAAAAHHDPRAHAAVHLLAGMAAPAGLVLGAPVSLLLRAGSPGLRRRVVPLLRGRALGVLSHPVTAPVLGPGATAGHAVPAEAMYAGPAPARGRLRPRGAARGRAAHVLRRRRRRGRAGLALCTAWYRAGGRELDRVRRRRARAG